VHSDPIACSRARLGITIGPYETYNDELFGYKASFEAYITIRDDKETGHLKEFAGRLQEVENNLPIDPAYRNPKLGAAAPPPAGAAPSS